MTDDFRARLHQAWTEEHGHAPTWVEEILIDTYAEHMDAAMDRIFRDVVDWKPLGLLGVDVAPWLADELDIQGVSPIRAALERARPHSTPPAALRGPSSSVPPNGTPAEEERTLANRVRSARDLVRQADAPILAAAAAQLLGDFGRWELGPATSGEPATEEERVHRELVPLVRAAAAEVPAGDVGNLRLDPELARLRYYVQADRKHNAGLPCWCDGVLLGGLAVHQDDRIPRGSPGFAFIGDSPEGWFRP